MRLFDISILKSCKLFADEWETVIFPHETDNLNTLYTQILSQIY